MKNRLIIEISEWSRNYMSVAKFFGGGKFKGVEFVLIGDDLVQKKWQAVYEHYGRRFVKDCEKSGRLYRDVKREMEREMKSLNENEDDE